MSQRDYNDVMYKSYKEDCETLKPTHPELAATFARWSFLHDVLAWAKTQGSRIGAMEFVQQDEFSHDAILHDQSSHQYIAFGVT